MPRLDVNPAQSYRPSNPPTSLSHRPDAVVAAAAVLPDLAARFACDHEPEDVTAAEVRRCERTSDVLVAEVGIFVCGGSGSAFHDLT